MSSEHNIILILNLMAIFYGNEEAFVGFIPVLSQSRESPACMYSVSGSWFGFHESTKPSILLRSMNWYEPY